MASAQLRAGVKLGVDVGTVRVGLAAADRDGILAVPVRTLNRDAKKNSDIRIVVREAAERGAVGIYVGLPRTLKGTETASAAMAREYAALLVAALGDAGLDVRVWLVDERLSSVSAHAALRSAGMSGREQRKVVDQAAAAGILQHALDMEKSLSQPAGPHVPPVTDSAGGRVGQPTLAKDRDISSESNPRGSAL
ncbi:MAG: Holliday junction resolvase RuvX [Actinomycetales bacterium]